MIFFCPCVMILLPKQPTQLKQLIKLIEVPKICKKFYLLIKDDVKQQEIKELVGTYTAVTMTMYYCISTPRTHNFLPSSKNFEII